jgi:hypothetical protein
MAVTYGIATAEKKYDIHLFIHSFCSVLQQVHNIFQREFST